MTQCILKTKTKIIEILSGRTGPPGPPGPSGGGFVDTRGGVWVGSSSAAIDPATAPEIFLFFPEATTISGANLLSAGGPGNVAIDVRKKALSTGFPPVDADSITGGNPVTVSGGSSVANADITGWNTTVEAGSVLGLKLISSETFSTIQLNIIT